VLLIIKLIKKKLIIKMKIFQ